MLKVTGPSRYNCSLSLVHRAQVDLLFAIVNSLNPRTEQQSLLSHLRVKLESLAGSPCFMPKFALLEAHINEIRLHRKLKALDLAQNPTNSLLLDWSLISLEEDDDQFHQASSSQLTSVKTSPTFGKSKAQLSTSCELPVLPLHSYSEAKCLKSASVGSLTTPPRKRNETNMDLFSTPINISSFHKEEHVVCYNLPENNLAAYDSKKPLEKFRATHCSVNSNSIQREFIDIDSNLLIYLYKECANLIQEPASLVKMTPASHGQFEVVLDLRRRNTLRKSNTEPLLKTKFQQNNSLPAKIELSTRDNSQVIQPEESKERLEKTSPSIALNKSLGSLSNATLIDLDNGLNELDEWQEKLKTKLYKPKTKRTPMLKSSVGEKTKVSKKTGKVPMISVNLLRKKPSFQSMDSDIAADLP